MASNTVRRPLPALIALVALLILTGLVWWRVIDRGSGASAQGPSKTPGSTCSATGTPAPPPVVAQLPKASKVNVLVLNSTARTGLASKARDALLQDGFKSTRQAANYTGSPKVTGVGEIRYGPKSIAGGALLAYYLPGAQLVKTSTGSALVTVILGPQYHFVRSQKAAEQAIKSASTGSRSTPPASSTPSSGSSAGC